MTAIPDKLKAAVQKNNLVIFVGAGLSINLKNQKGEALGNWSNLVKQIILHLNGNTNQFDHLLQCLNHYEPIDVLQLIQKSKDIAKSDVYDFVKDFFVLHQDNDYKLHKKIAQLSSIIVTTNYDTAFEESTQHFKGRIAYKGKNYELTKHKDNKPVLFKLHGCISDASSMVLFPSNYDDLYVRETNDAQHVLTVLKNLIYNKTILFIGCGMGDFQINHIFRTIKEMQADFGQSHFIISKDRIDSSLDFLTSIAIKEHIEINTVLDTLLNIKDETEKERDKEIIEQQKQTENLKDRLAAIESKHEKLIEELFGEAIEFGINMEFKKAAKKYEQITDLEEVDVVFCNWGSILGKWAGIEFGLDVNILYREAIEKFKKAVAIKPDYPEALSNWGACLWELCNSKLETDTETICLDAIEKYKKAIDIKPDFPEALTNWGIALYKLATTKSGSNVGALCEEAIDKYKQAIALKPDFPEAVYNWGNCLKVWAITGTGLDIDDLYWKAIRKYEQAITLRPNYYEVYNAWGGLLSMWAGTKHGTDAKELYLEAIEKYRQAIAIKPDCYRTLAGWGFAFTKLSTNKVNAKSTSQAKALFDEAIAQYKQSIELDEECYNLACLYAMLSNKINAFLYLNISLSKQEVTVSFVKEDTDWQQYWQDADFINLLEKYS